VKYRSASIRLLFHIVKFYTGLCNIGYCLYDSTFAAGFNRAQRKGRLAAPLGALAARQAGLG
jgi:hypothetical protein